MKGVTAVTRDVQNGALTPRRPKNRLPENSFLFIFLKVVKVRCQNFAKVGLYSFDTEARGKTFYTETTFQQKTCSKYNNENISKSNAVATL